MPHRPIGVPGPIAGRRGRRGGARGRKDEKTHFWGTSVSLYREANVGYPVSGTFIFVLIPGC